MKLGKLHDITTCSYCIASGKKQRMLLHRLQHQVTNLTNFLQRHTLGSLAWPLVWMCSSVGFTSYNPRVPAVGVSNQVWIQVLSPGWISKPPRLFLAIAASWVLHVMEHLRPGHGTVNAWAGQNPGELWTHLPPSISV
jgi:hypothetical protein